MSEQLSRGLSALIEDEGHAFTTTGLGHDPDQAVRAVGRARHRRTASIGVTSLAAVVAIAVGATLWPNGATTEIEPAVTELLQTATTRTSSDPETRDDAQAGIHCTWAEGEGPRDVAATVDSAIIMDECAAVWVGEAPLVDAFTSWMVGVGDSTATRTAHWTVVNTSDKPLSVDADAVAPAFEIPDLEIDTIGGNDGLALVAKDLWVSETERFTLLTSETGTVTLAPGDTLEGTVTLAGDEYISALSSGAAQNDYLRIPLASAEHSSLILEVPVETVMALPYISAS
ncbi:hypothetical protein [Demequina sp. NBRC 110055]|uniref:hypothetical protein n=1 Tax=Demequina sp. NBRC 110055 TaxID=1570344 RepID=UPI000A050BD2|nr:hypothetical protein [Demequina sp. NBRC 110055]